MISADDVGPLELLVIQPTPFCNLDCSYCYLPDRLNKRKITLETLEKALNWVFSSGLVRQPFHTAVACRRADGSAGDLLRTGYACSGAVQRQRVRGDPILQTNATLVNNEWCDFIRRCASPGRRQRRWPRFPERPSSYDPQGAGTLDRVLRGMRLLRDHDIPFDVITVLTSVIAGLSRRTLRFLQRARHHLGRFQCRGDRGAARHIVALQVAGWDRGFGVSIRASWTLRCRRTRHSGCASSTPQSIPSPTTSIPENRAQECKPFAILNVDHQGNFSTYSPEMLGLSSPRHGSFALGNVGRETRWKPCWRCRGFSPSTMRSVAVWICATKPAVTFRFAAEGHRATSISKTETSPLQRRCPVACINRRPSMSRLISLNYSSP